MSDEQKSPAAWTADIVSALTIGSLLWPGKWHLDLLSQHPSEIQKIAEAVAGFLAAIRLYIAQPHPAIEGPFADAKFWIMSHFRGKAQP